VYTLYSMQFSKLKVAQKNMPFEKRMEVHCDVVYEEVVRWFGIVEHK